MVDFKEIYHFSRFQRGSNIFQGGGPTFPGGSNCLFPIETHIICDFPGGGLNPLSPPLDPHLSKYTWEKRIQTKLFSDFLIKALNPPMLNGIY